MDQAFAVALPFAVAPKSCNHALYDAGCTVTRTSFKIISSITHISLTARTAPSISRSRSATRAAAAASRLRFFYDGRPDQSLVSPTLSPIAKRMKAAGVATTLIKAALVGRGLETGGGVAALTFERLIAEALARRVAAGACTPASGLKSAWGGSAEGSMGGGRNFGRGRCGDGPRVPGLAHPRGAQAGGRSLDEKIGILPWYPDPCPV